MKGTSQSGWATAEDCSAPPWPYPGQSREAPRVTPKGAPGPPETPGPLPHTAGPEGGGRQGPPLTALPRPRKKRCFSSSESGEKSKEGTGKKRTEQERKMKRGKKGKISKKGEKSKKEKRAGQTPSRSPRPAPSRGPRPPRPLCTHRPGCWRWSAAPAGTSEPPASCGSRSASPCPARRPAESSAATLRSRSGLLPTSEGLRQSSSLRPGQEGPPTVGSVHLTCSSPSFASRLSAPGHTGLKARSLGPGVGVQGGHTSTRTPAPEAGRLEPQ